MGILENESVRFEIAGHRAHLTIARPESLNALNPDVLQSLVIVFEKLERNRDVRVAVISGDGPKAFVAGADIRSMVDLGPRPFAEYVELGQRAMRAIERSRVPVIAAVNGYALGGGLELALACDIIVASKNAKLGLPEVSLGIIPGFGGTQRLRRRCGLGVAKRLVYTGDYVGADEALAIGLVDKVVEQVDLFAHVSTLAESIASRAPLAVQSAKRVFGAAEHSALLAGLRHEVETFLSLVDTADREEGMHAFLQKRPPVFKGH